MRPRASVSQRGVLNPEAAARHFELERHPPAEDLAFFVERHWIIRWDLRGRDPYVQETLPQPCVNLVLEADRAAIHGVGTQCFRARLEGEGQVFGTKFRPGAFFPFIQRPVSELCDRAIDLVDLFGDEARTLGPTVLASRSSAEQLAIVEAFLRPRLPARDPNVARVVGVVQVALDNPEITRVEQLAALVHESPRTMQRLFQRYVGVSPKWVIRRFRLHEAADRISAGEIVDWSALAQALGYFDQAHFSKDFKAQLGRSPSEYATQVRRA